MMSVRQKIGRQAGIGAVVVFVLCLGVGNWLSQRKPLWNDEIHTQFDVIEEYSYQDILFNRIRLEEGNSCPLFYLIQKGICDMAQYRFPIEWEWEWSISDKRSQIILRVSSNIFMSLSIALIFYFFAHVYSGWSGLYSLLVSLSSYVVWVYWAEARPYALWFFLTTVQSLLFLNVIRQKGRGARAWRGLVVIHILLSLTVILSIVQILIVSFLLWLFKKGEGQRYFLLTFIPGSVCLGYYFCSTIVRYQVSNPLQLIYESIPPDRLLIPVFYAVFLFFGFFSGRGRLRREGEQTRRVGGSYLALTVFMVAAAVVLLLMMKWRAMQGQAVLTLSGRYFIFLTPVGIIAATLFSLDFIRAFKDRIWMLTNSVIILGGLLMVRFLRTYMDVVGLKMY